MTTETIVNAEELAVARSYPNGTFDLVQAVAQRLTDADRAAGREAPAYGYSDANVRRAELAVYGAPRRPCTVNRAMADIAERARKTFPRASTVVTYTTESRDPRRGLCRVDVVELSGSAMLPTIARTIWRGPVANGADAAGLAAWDRVFAPK